MAGTTTGCAVIKILHLPLYQPIFFFLLSYKFLYIQFFSFILNTLKFVVIKRETVVLTRESINSIYMYVYIRLKKIIISKELKGICLR